MKILASKLTECNPYINFAEITENCATNFSFKKKKKKSAHITLNESKQTNKQKSCEK